MHSKEGGILTAMCQVGGHVECKKTITMPNGGTQENGDRSAAQPEDQGSKSFLSMEFKCFYMDHTQGEVNDTEVQVPKPSVLDDLLGVSSTSMDVDPSSVNGETEFNTYMRVQEVVNDTDPLMWWKQHQEEFPRLARMARQYLAVPASSASPERLFSSVGLVKSDLRGRLLHYTYARLYM